MRLTFDNNWLFTAGKDGCLIIHKVDDRDVRGGVKHRERDAASIMPFSDEIQTEKQEMEEIYNLREQLENELESIKEPTAGGQQSSGTNEQEEKIAELNEMLSSNQLQTRNKIEQLETRKAEIEEDFEKQIRALEEQNNEELEARRNEYSQKMLEDAARYQQLVDQQAEEASKFRAAQTSIFEEHTVQVNQKRREHQDFIEIQKNQIQHLKDQITTMARDNAETMGQIDDDAKKEIEQIQTKNAASLAQVKDMGLMSTAELQNKKNKLQDLAAEIELVDRQIKDKQQ